MVPLLFSAVLSFCGVGFTIFAAINVDTFFDRPLPLICVAATVWVPHTGLGLYMTFSTCKYCLTITSTEIRQVGPFTDATLLFADVTTVQWALHPTRESVIINSPRCHMQIYFRRFTADERTTLKRLLTSQLPTAAQAS